MFSIMFKNYLKIAWRNLAKNKSFTIINITGLAVGMASAVLILLWIENEVSFDRFHEKQDRIYQVYQRSPFDGKLSTWAITAKPLADELRSSHSEIEDAARTYDANFLFTTGDKHLNVHGNFTDPGFLNIFSFPLVYGSNKTALNDPHNIVITEKLAKKLFGAEDAMGKTIKIDSVDRFTVTGVLKDLPNNTRFSFEYLMPWSYLKQLNKDDANWRNNSCFTYVSLKPGITLAAADAQLKNIVNPHIERKDVETFLHPVAKWRLYSKFENGVAVGGRIETVKLFAVIAAFILLIACINFMNLSTARSEKRAKEVGIRKVSGALKSSLVIQFLIESILISVGAGVLALFIVNVSLPGFNSLTDKQLYLPFTSAYFWMISMGFILFTGILAGSYPAFFLSSFKPISVLKGSFKAANALVTPRKALVVVQFSFAIVLIICTIIVQKQINYAQTRSTGYNTNNLIYTMMTGTTEKNYMPIKNELLISGAAISVTKTSAPMTQSWSSTNDYTWEGKDPASKVEIRMFNTDGDFTKTVGLKLTSGRDIDVKNFPSDSTAALLNESAASVMGFKNPIGQVITLTGETKPVKWHVVGVIKDFIMESPFEPIQPMVVQGPKGWFNVINFKLNPALSTTDAMNKAEAVFKRYNPDYPFEYNFTDTEYELKFYDEQRTKTLATLFSALTIIISCLGLFGLSAYMAENRIKEIGVRKVLGASSAGIAALLSKDFLKLVGIAFLVASPISWYAMSKWLQGYNYRITISLWVFVIAGAVSVLIAVATISYQAIKAALSNPVKSLRSE
jgi:putative ABC transport system permease protein